MAGLRSWLGLADDDDPVQKALGLLGQGGSAPEASYNDPTAGGTLAQPLPPSPEPAAPPWASAVDLGSRALGAVGDAAGSLGTAATGLYDRRAAEIAAEPAAPDPSVPSDTNPLAADLPQRNPLPVLGAAATRAGTGLYEAAQDPRNAMDTVTAAGRAAATAGMEAATAPADVTTALPSARGLKIVQDAINAGGTEVGRRVGRAMGLTDQELFRAFGMPVSGEDIAGFVGGAVLDPTNYIGGGEARTAARGAEEAARGIGSRIRGALDANAERVGAADARMAAQGSTVAPGTLGVISGNPLEANTAAGSRVIPPHVADTLDFPVRVPTDPAVIRAIEAAGGSVDPERGVNLHTIRMEGPEAHGKPATRSSVFAIAGKPGEASPYAAGEGASVGGSERIEGPTTFRSPLVLSDAPGSNTGFDAGMAQLGVRGKADAATIQELERDLGYAERLVQANPRAYSQSMIDTARQALEEARGGSPVTATVIDEAIRSARRAGPPGSPERAQALKDLVTRYGGDPEAIDHLLEVRGADHQESAWAIKENILAHNARAKGYDGVLTVQSGMSPSEYQAALTKAVEAHPDYQAQQAAYEQVNTRYQAAQDRADETLKKFGPGTPEDYAAYQALDEASKALSAADRRLQNVHDRLVDTVHVEVPSKITELADFRESHNPTPSTSGPEWAAAHQQVESLGARLDVASKAADAAERAGDDTALRYAMREYNGVRREYDAAVTARESLRGAAPGYTLRSDLPRRPTGGPEVGGATLGTLPEAAAPTDRLGSVNRVLGQGLVSSVSGGVGAQVNQQANPDDPYAAAKGFAAGALLPLAASKGAGAVARRVGAEAGAEGGALMALGHAPGPAGGPGGGLFGAFPAAATWYRRASARNAAEMAARNIAPASAVDVVRSAASSVGHGAMLGPSTAGVNTLQALWNVGWALPKEPLRAAGRAISTGNASALREPGEMAFGAARGMSRLGEAVWDVVRGAGKYAPVPGHEPTSARVADPFTRALLSALEAPGRVFGGLPDAISGTIAEGSVAARRAAQKATDAGLSGADWEDEVDRLVAEAEAHRKAARAGSTAAPSDPDVADVVGAADKAGERAGLRQPLGTIGTQARKVAKLGDAPVIGEFVAPYFNSPWNAMLQMAERSPAGFFMNTQASKFDKHYDAVVGSAAALALGDQLRRGNITVNGSGPTDPNERQAWADRGNRPYSIKVYDRYVPNRVFGYAEGLLNAVGEYHDALAYRKPEADSRWVQQDAFARIGRLLKEQPYAAGYATIADMAQHGPAALAADLAGRLTPGAATMRAIGTSQDPSERAPDRGAGVPLETEAYQRWQQSVGLRSGLPVAQDILGRPKENPQQGAAAFFPRAGVEKRDPVIEAFQEARVFPGDPPRTLSGAGVTDPDLKPELSPAEQRRWNEIRGEGLIRKVQPLIDSGKLASGTPEQRANALEDAKRNAADYADVTLAREIGRDELVRRYEARKARKAAS